MKNLLLATTIFSIALLFSCASEQKADYLPELKVEVPESLKDNPEAIEFIETTEQALNKWSVTFEDLVIECEPFANKTEAELSTMDKLKLGKIMMEFMAGMGQFAVKIGEMEQSMTVIEDGLDETEAEALAAVMDSFEKRVAEIGNKYENFGKDSTELMQ